MLSVLCCVCGCGCGGGYLLYVKGMFVCVCCVLWWVCCTVLCVVRVDCYCWIVGSFLIVGYWLGS